MQTIVMFLFTDKHSIRTKLDISLLDTQDSIMNLRLRIIFIVLQKWIQQV